MRDAAYDPRLPGFDVELVVSRKLCPSVRRIHCIGAAMHDIFVKGVFRRTRFRCITVKTNCVGFVISKKRRGVAFIRQLIFSELLVVRAYHAMSI